MGVVVAQEALETGFFRGRQNTIEITGRHRISTVGHTSGVHPRDNFVRIADRIQGPLSLLLYYLVGIRLGKPPIHIPQ